MDIGQAIRAGDLRLARIDVSKLGFLAQRDLPPVELPLQRMPQKVAVLRKETASVQLSLEAEIDQFHLEDKGVPERPVELLDSKIKSNIFSAAYPPKLIVARVNTSLEEEEEGMDLKQRTGIKGLLASRNKGSTSKEAPTKGQSQKRPLRPKFLLVFHLFPPLPPPPPKALLTNLGLKANPNLRKKMPVEDLEEGEVAPQKGVKQ